MTFGLWAQFQIAQKIAKQIHQTSTNEQMTSGTHHTAHSKMACNPFLFSASFTNKVDSSIEWGGIFG